MTPSNDTENSETKSPDQKSQDPQTTDTSSETTQAKSNDTPPTAEPDKSVSTSDAANGEPAAEKKDADQTQAGEPTHTPTTKAQSPTQTQVMPGGAFGLVILLLIASIIGGLIVTMLPGFGNNYQRTGTGSPQIENRMAAAEQELTTLKKELSETVNRAQALEAFLQEGGNVSAPSSGTLSVLEEIQNRLDGLEETVAILQTAAPIGQGETLAENPEIAPALTALSTELAALKTDLTKRLQTLEDNAPPANLQETLSSLAPQTALEELSARITTIEEDKSGSEAKQAALALSIANLARAIQSNQAFASELQALQVVAPDLQYPGEITLAASTGVETKEVLKSQFSELAYSTLQAERGGAPDNWVGQLQSNFDSLFSVRRTGDIEGEGTEATLARAEQRLKKDDFQGALDELKRLKGTAAETVTPWTASVATRLQLDAFLDQLNQKVIKQISQE